MTPSFLARLAIIIAAVAFAAPAPAAEAPKIAVVDIDKIVSELARWKDTNARIADEREKAEQTLAEMKQVVDRLEAELAYFKPDSRDYQERRAVVQERAAELARASQRAIRAIEEMTDAALRAELGRIYEHVRKFAVAQGYDIILDSRAAIYIAGGRDVSLEVALEMNKMYKESQASTEEQALKKKEATEKK